jgi:hypothetical protein
MSDVQPFQIDAISPLIRYNSVTNSSLTGWIPPTRANDAFYDPDIPYPFVTSANSSLSLNFFGVPDFRIPAISMWCTDDIWLNLGTGVTVYGSIQLYPPSVCSYRVDLAPEGLFVLSSSDPFDGVLANFVNLTANQHTMTLTTQCNQTTTAHLPTNVTFSHADIYPWQSGYTVSNTQVVDDADSKAVSRSVFFEFAGLLSGRGFSCYSIMEVGRRMQGLLTLGETMTLRGCVTR